jgi:hypothetical protein
MTWKNALLAALVLLVPLTSSAQYGGPSAGSVGGGAEGPEGPPGSSDYTPADGAAWDFIGAIPTDFAEALDSAIVGVSAFVSYFTGRYDSVVSVGRALLDLKCEPLPSHPRRAEPLAEF